MTVRINFTVYEPGGVEGLIDESANFTLRNNSFSRTGSCTPTNLNSTSVRYNCSLSLTHFDTAGTWIVNVSIGDRGQTNVSNASMTATINSLLAINVTATSLSFGTLGPGTGPTAAAVPIIIDNDGNVNISWLNITTYTLINGTGSIGVGNITVNSTPNVGTRFTNATPLNLTNSSVPLDTALAPGNRSLYFYITVPNGTPSYAYTPILAWEVTTT